MKPSSTLRLYGIGVSFTQSPFMITFNVSANPQKLHREWETRRTAKTLCYTKKVAF